MELNNNRRFEFIYGETSLLEVYVELDTCKRYASAGKTWDQYSAMEHGLY